MVQCKRDESITKQSIFVETYFFLEEAFESYWSSLADKNKQLPKSTRRNIKSNFFSGKTSKATRSEEKRLFWQARKKSSNSKRAYLASS